MTDVEGMIYELFCEALDNGENIPDLQVVWDMGRESGLSHGRITDLVEKARFSR